MVTELKPLPIRFIRDGFLFWQICRTDKAAIYEQKQIETGRVWFEVWKIRARGSFTLDGKLYPAMEREPGAAVWGTYGWTYQNLPDARKRYDLVNGRVSVPFQGVPDLPALRDTGRG
jgi:hypothetical protein